MSGVAFLPEELASAEERLGIFELPTDNRVPLVEFERKIAVRTDPFGIIWVHSSLGCRANSDRFFEVGLTARIDGI